MKTSKQDLGPGTMSPLQHGEVYVTDDGAGVSVSSPSEPAAPVAPKRPYNKKTAVSMFETVDSLKEFLIWAKRERISAIKVGEVEVHFSTLAFVESEPDLGSPKPKTPSASEERDTSTTLVDENQDEDDKELLNWSSGG